jgi:hypothetical protein
MSLKTASAKVSGYRSSDIGKLPQVLRGGHVIQLWFY